MSRRVIVLCDLCTDERPSAGAPVVVAVGKLERVLDVCDMHHRELIAPVVAALETYGRTERAPRPPEHDAPARELRGPSRDVGITVPCVLRLCGYTSSSPTGYRQHLAQTHGLRTITDIVGDALGRTCPLCGRRFDTVTILGNHIGRVHSPEEVPSSGGYWFALQVARHTGDPHGIAAGVDAYLGRKGEAA